MTASKIHGSTVTRVVRERLLRPIWNSLVAYGAIWLPPIRTRSGSSTGTRPYRSSAR
ncbi:hypothetical protein SHIRM173S_10694 [Streptomyces hirsutus]